MRADRNRASVDSGTATLGTQVVLPHEWAHIARHLELTPREHQVLRFTFEGLTRDAIAQELDVSTRTVRQHLENLHLKLKVKDRIELVLTVVLARDELRERNVSALEPIG